LTPVLNAGFCLPSAMIVMNKEEPPGRKPIGFDAAKGLSRDNLSNRFLRSRLSRASGGAGWNGKRPHQSSYGRSVTCHFRAFKRGGLRVETVAEP